MTVRLHPHCMERMSERGAGESEVSTTVLTGSRLQARFGRISFRKEFPGPWTWQGKRYEQKEVEAIAVPDGSDWLVITVIVRYF
ncbi:MAG: DUF4258 domain-containing protein [Rhodospirillaceae bacterium]|nr:DUF4258 domain-containing protein [Rhodospirillaceae bacterium]